MPQPSGLITNPKSHKIALTRKWVFFCEWRMSAPFGVLAAFYVTVSGNPKYLTVSQNPFSLVYTQPCRKPRDSIQPRGLLIQNLSLLQDRQLVKMLRHDVISSQGLLTHYSAWFCLKALWMAVKLRPRGWTRSWSEAEAAPHDPAAELMEANENQCTLIHSTWAQTLWVTSAW